MLVTYTDLSSFQLALVGIMVSVLAMVFALVVGKRDELRTLKSMNDTLTRNRRVALGNSIDKLTSYCQQIIAIIVVLLLLNLGTMALNGILCKGAICLAVTIEAVITGGVLVWVVIASAIIWNKINKD